MPAEPTPEHVRAFLADCNQRRHGWASFQRGNRRSALRIIRNMAEETPVARYEVRTIDADPTTGDIDFHKAPPQPVYYIHDTGSPAGPYRSAAPTTRARWPGTAPPATPAPDRPTRQDEPHV